MGFLGVMLLIGLVEIKSCLQGREIAQPISSTSSDVFQSQQPSLHCQGLNLELLAQAMVPGQLQSSEQGGSCSLNISEHLSTFPSYYVTMCLCVCMGWKSEGSLCLLAPRGLDRKASLWKNLPFQSSWVMDINGWQLPAE